MPTAQPISKSSPYLYPRRKDIKEAWFFSAEEFDAAFNAALAEAQASFALYPQHQKAHAAEIKKLLVIMNTGVGGKIDACAPAKKALSL